MASNLAFPPRATIPLLKSEMVARTSGEDAREAYAVIIVKYEPARMGK